MTPYFDDGQIQIWHADCRDVLPTIEPGTVDLVLTDPPYGIALQEHGRNGYDWTVLGDDDQSLGHLVLESCRHWPIITFASPKKPWPGQWRQHLVWDKGPAVGGGGDPKTCWKSTWELVQVTGTPVLNGSRDSAVLTYWVGQRDYHDHPCQKPVALLSYLIRKATGPDDLILDPFMGSGSTLRAAKNLGRKAIGIEIEERYVEIAVKRLHQAVLPMEVA